MGNKEGPSRIEAEGLRYDALEVGEVGEVRFLEKAVVAVVVDLRLSFFEFVGVVKEEGYDPFYGLRGGVSACD